MKYDLAIYFQYIELSKEHGILKPIYSLVGKMQKNCMKPYLQDPVPPIFAIEGDEACLYEFGFAFPISNQELIHSYFPNSTSQDISESDFEQLVYNYEQDIMNQNIFSIQVIEGEFHFYCINPSLYVQIEIDPFRSYYQCNIDNQDKQKVLLPNRGGYFYGL